MFTEIEEGGLVPLGERFFHGVYSTYAPQIGEAIVTGVGDSIHTMPRRYIVKNGTCDILCGCGYRTYNLGMRGIFCHHCSRQETSPEQGHSLDVYLPEGIMNYVH